ncbi:hypothetical protein [Actinophytocola sediminis]
MPASRSPDAAGALGLRVSAILTKLDLDNRVHIALLVHDADLDADLDADFDLRT